MKPILQKPEWLKKQVFFTDKNQYLRNKLKGSKTHTVCEEARCPNLSECYNEGTATFMILGRVCTRSCRFCAVESAPLRKRSLLGKTDENEPFEIASLVKAMNLKFAVITSVARDDLKDEGSGHFADTLTAIKRLNPLVKCEVLTPDFHARVNLIENVINANPDIFNHNMETVENLSDRIRNGANYHRSLEVLKIAKQINPDIITKSGVMLGFGEKENELLDLFSDLVKVNCDVLTIGQYLQPTRRHTPVVKYIPQEYYLKLKNYAEQMGIKLVYAGAFVRSSYKAHESYSLLKKQD